MNRRYRARARDSQSRGVPLGDLVDRGPGRDTISERFALTPPTDGEPSGWGNPGKKGPPSGIGSAGGDPTGPMGGEVRRGEPGGEARAAREGDTVPLCGGAGAEPPATSSEAAERPPPNLDTPGITGGGSRDRVRLLRDVEEKTLSHRTAKAQRLWRRANEVYEARIANGETREDASRSRRWHLRRSHGQMHRFESVRACRERKVWVVCIKCARVKEQERTCGASRLCFECRLNEGAALRARFERARKRAQQRAADRGLLGPRRLGRWREKLLTLTLPHGASNTVAGRIAFMFRAWRPFTQSLSAWVRSKGDASGAVAFLRVFEWTPGSDGLGHPHFHIWILCPFFDKDKVTHWWRNALRSAKVAPEIAAAAHVHLCVVKTRDGAARELIKYLTKDILPSGELISSKVFAELYIALDGRRVTQASSGFFKGIERKAECECGAAGCFRRTLQEPEVGSDGKVTDDALQKLAKSWRRSPKFDE